MGQFLSKQFSNLLLLVVILTASSAQAEQRVQLQSPDGRVSLAVENQQGKIVWSIDRDGQPLVAPSQLGIQIDDFAGNLLIAKSKLAEFDATWRPVWGKRSTVQNRYHSADIHVHGEGNSTVRYVIDVRVYNDGGAVRYRLPATSEADESQREISKDLTEFRFTSDVTCWSYNGENPNVGPESVRDIDSTRQVPLLAKCANDCFVAIHEAALYDAPWMSLHGDGDGSLNVETPEYSVTGEFETPWRVLMVGDTPGALLDSDLLLNLNPPCELADTSWIKPGVCFWDWRAWGHQVDGFTYELSLPSWQRFVDFAAESGVPYLLLDANWYGPEFESESNPTETGKVNAVRELLDYANKQNVGVLLYLNDVAGRKYDLEDVLKNYRNWGAVGIKYGFMKGGGRDKVERTRRIIELCAKNQLFVDFHDGPIPPSGDMRTWPNCLTREYCHAQSDSKRAFTPKTFTTHAYVNGLAGSLDMANGMFDLNHSLEQRPRVFEQVNSTIVAEAARSLIVFSGLNVLPDSADSYRKHRQLFEFIAAQKMPWTESRTLRGEIGEYIVTLRQTGDVYLVGSATNENSRELSIPLDFLPPGEFTATLYEDAADAHFENNREAYEIRTRQVNRKDLIKARLAPGGGHAIRLVPAPK